MNNVRLTVVCLMVLLVAFALAGCSSAQGGPTSNVTVTTPPLSSP